jgi:hypothetical protein
MKGLALLIWLFLAAGLTHGQSVDSDAQLPEPRKPSTLPATQQYSSEKIEIRKFDETKWREIVKSGNYTDTRTKKTPKDRKKGEDEAGQGSGSRRQDGDEEDRYEYDNEEGSTIDLSWLGPLGQIIFYVAIAAIIVVILLQIVRNTSFKSNVKRPLVSADNTEEIHDISELDTENLIQKAHSAGDYKLAIRLYFLDLLKKLNENGVIIWTKDKTNRDYLSELFSKGYHFDDVRRLTLAYERVWYGEHIPTEERYHELKNEFQEMNQKFKVS